MLTENAYIPVKVAPGAEKPGLVNFMRAMVSNPVSAIPAAAYQEPITLLPMPGPTIAFVSAPDLLEEILIRRVADFPKSEVDERVLRPAFGDSLLTAHGESWRWKRRLAAPYFAPSALARSVPDMVAPFRAVSETWRKTNAAESRDVTSAMTSATFEVISRTLFSQQDEVDFTAISEAIDSYLAPISWVIGLASLKVPAWVPHPGSGRIRRASRRMRSIVGDLVLARRGSVSESEDICGDLMHARDPETDRPLDDNDLVDMLLTLIAAGHETSANALTWALYCLAEQPELQEILVAEIEKVTGTRSVEAADLPKLQTVEAFIKETMRLFPPAPLLARRTIRAERLGTHSVESGTLLFIPVYAIHRHKRLWRDPDHFDLTRFQGESAKHIARTAYLPFGAGPRVCVGATFAMMEMVAGLATLLQSCRFAIDEDAHYEPIQRITLKPKGGLRLQVLPASAI